MTSPATMSGTVRAGGHLDFVALTLASTGCAAKRGCSAPFTGGVATTWTAVIPALAFGAAVEDAGETTDFSSRAGSRCQS